MILVTGGSGFIGSNFVLDWCASTTERVVNLDALTYSGNASNLARVERNDQHVFVLGNICDADLLDALLLQHRPRAIIHFAAESHVDRSISGPADFIDTNVVGTFRLLEAAKRHRDRLPAAEAAAFRFLHVSTDEVFGSLGPADAPFTETSRYEPNSPYSASKAASDHLVRAYFHTYGLDTVTTNCSNNYGPFQFPEKLIPLTIVNGAAGRPLPVYGDGAQIRDWLHVSDHCAALRAVLERGLSGETYNIGGNCELRNLVVVQKICRILDEVSPATGGRPREELITFVADRPGHDRRYAIDSSKLLREVGWAPSETFDCGLRKTVAWYLQNPDWVQSITSGSYRDWIQQHYGALRLPE